MRQRWIVIGLFAAALALVVLRVLPARTTAAAARHESEVWRSHAERAARLRPAAPNAEERVPAESGPGAGARRVRREVLAVVAGLPLTGVTLEVRESPSFKTAVDVKLAAKGRFADLVDLTGRLSRTPGLALGVVRFGPRDDVARLELRGAQQMKPVVPLAAVLLAGTALTLGWRVLHAPPAARTHAPEPRPVPSARPAEAPAELPRLTRDLLRYEDARPSPLAPAPPAPPRAVAPPPAPPAAHGPRLLGFVRQQGRLKAALLFPGNEAVVTLSAGESEAGHTLLALDEEQGALLRLPDGSELSLAPPQ